MKFENIKVGDFVAIRNYYSLKKSRVAKVTKTMFGVEDMGVRYSRKTGRALGKYGSFFKGWAEPWTHEHKEELKKEKEWKTQSALAKKIEVYDWFSLTIDELKKVISALKEIGIDVEGTNNATS